MLSIRRRGTVTQNPRSSALNIAPQTYIKSMFGDLLFNLSEALRALFGVSTQKMFPKSPAEDNPESCRQVVKKHGQMSNQKLTKMKWNYKKTSNPNTTEDPLSKAKQTECKALVEPNNAESLIPLNIEIIKTTLTSAPSHQRLYVGCCFSCRKHLQNSKNHKCLPLI